MTTAPTRIPLVRLDAGQTRASDPEEEERIRYLLGLVLTSEPGTEAASPGDVIDALLAVTTYRRIRTLTAHLWDLGHGIEDRLRNDYAWFLPDEEKL